MIGKTMMIAGLAFAIAIPAAAQTTTTPQQDTNGTMQSGTMQNGTMSADQSNGTMAGSDMGMSKMSKGDMASMKRCKAMSSDAMAKSKKCTMLMQKYPDSTGNSATSPS